MTATWLEFTQALPLLRNALLLGLLIGAVAPLVGGWFVLRRMILLGVAIPQVSSAGVSLVLFAHGVGLFGLSPLHVHGPQPVIVAVSLLVTTGVIVCLGWVSRRRPEWNDIAVGFVFALATGSSFLLLGQSPVAEANMLDLLKGEILSTTDHQLVATAVALLLIGAGFRLFHQEFFLIAHDRDFALSLRKPVGAHDILFYFLAGCAVTVFVMTAGPVTTFGYLILPPVAALMLARGMRSFFWLASLLGMAASVVSLVIGFFYDLPIGPVSVVVLAAACPLCWLLARAGSWFRRGADSTP